MPSRSGRAATILRRLGTLLGLRREEAGPGAPSDADRARWPHLQPGWLDPDVVLRGWRTTVDVRDLGDALRAIAPTSGERFGEPEVSEILDVVARGSVGDSRAFRFGRKGEFRQLWIGVLRSAPETVRVFLLGDQAFADDADRALSVASFAGEKRAEYDLLVRFFLAAWEWRFTQGPAYLRARSSDLDPDGLGRQLKRFFSTGSTPLLEALRGLRGRVRELLERTQDLGDDDVRRADAFLSERGAPTLTEMRGRLSEADGAGAN